MVFRHLPEPEQGFQGGKARHSSADMGMALRVWRILGTFLQELVDMHSVDQFTACGQPFIKGVFHGEREVGISVSQVQMAADKAVSLNVLSRICDALDCDLFDILETSRDGKSSLNASKEVSNGK